MATVWEGFAYQIAHEARAGANCAQPGWVYVLDVPVPDFVGELMKPVHCRSHPTRATEGSEIVRIDCDLHHFESHTEAELSPEVGDGLIVQAAAVAA